MPIAQRSEADYQQSSSDVSVCSAKEVMLTAAPYNEKQAVVALDGEDGGLEEEGNSLFTHQISYTCL